MNNTTATGHSVIISCCSDLVLISMDEKELETLVKKIKAKDLKNELKQRGIPMGKCPTKLDLARKLPDDVVKSLAEK